MQRPDRRIRVALDGPDRNTLFSSDQNGIYTNTNDPIYTTAGQTTRALILGPSHLMRMFDNIPVNPGINVVDLTYKTLLAGNLVENEYSFNKIDIYDYNIMIQAFGPRMPAGGSVADLDFDGDVNLLKLKSFLKEKIKKAGFNDLETKIQGKGRLYLKFPVLY